MPNIPNEPTYFNQNDTDFTHPAIVDRLGLFEMTHWINWQFVYFHGLAEVHIDTLVNTGEYSFQPPDYVYSHRPRPSHNGVFPYAFYGQPASLYQWGQSENRKGLIVLDSDLESVEYVKGLMARQAAFC